MKVSIITCTLNSDRYLRQCLDSIAKQSYKNFDVLIIDGGSNDGTLEIANEYPFVRIYNDVKGGISNAMNYGISVATGEVISILHSDDYYYSNDVLSTIINSFKINEHAFWIYGDIARLEDKDIKISNAPYPFTIHRLLKRNFIPHPAVFVRSSLYNKVGHFNPKYRIAMDYDFIVRAAMQYPPVYIKKVLTVFRIHESSASHKNYLLGQVENMKISYTLSRKFVYLVYGVKNILQWIIAKKLRTAK